MSNKLNKNLFEIIDLNYWSKFGINGLETVIEDKENEMDSDEAKNEAYWEEVTENGYTIFLTNDTTIEGINLKRLGGYKALCALLKEDYKHFDEKIFKQIDIGYGESRSITVYEVVDEILTHYGFKKPNTSSQKVLRKYRDIFWVARRTEKLIQFSEKELKDLRLLLDIRKEEKNSVYDKTELQDFLEKDETNIDFFGLE